MKTPALRTSGQGTARIAVMLLGCVLSTLPLLRGADAGGEDWPRFLGPRGDGTSRESGLLARLPTGGPPVQWVRDIGTGYSAPSVRGDRLVLHHREGDLEIVEALEAATGRTLWKHESPTNYRDPFGYNNGPRCTPILTADRCYTYGVQGRLLCLDLATGTKIWEREALKDWQVPEAFFGVGSTPLLDEGRLYVMVGGQPNSGMVALDPETGRTLWESVGKDTWNGKPKLDWPGTPPVDWRGHEKMASYASPVAATVHGQRRLFCLMRQGLVMLDPATGQVDFPFWFRARVNESVNAANPVVVDNQVFFSSAYYGEGSVLLDLKPDLKGYERVWRDRVLEIHWSTPILAHGHLYAFSGRNEPDARFRCVELKTGQLKWDRDESWAKYSTKTPNRYGRGSAILAEDKLIVLGEGGLLGLFQAKSNRDQELGRWQVPGLHHPCWTAPVLSRGALYLRSEHKLVSLDFRASKVPAP